VNTAADATKPRLVEGVNILKLAIGPEEAFVLSRVDGQSSVQDIINATGLGPDKVQQALARLFELGAVNFGGSVVPVSAQVTSTTTPSQQPPISSVDIAQESSGVRSSTEEAAALPYDPAELEGDYELDMSRRQLVLDRYYRIDASNHYEVLGISSDADRRAIKSAYYELVAAIHPDKYFGKNIGPFRQKMERCFARLTEAYEAGYSDGEEKNTENFGEWAKG